MMRGGRKVSESGLLSQTNVFWSMKEVKNQDMYEMFAVTERCSDARGRFATENETTAKSEARKR